MLMHHVDLARALAHRLARLVRLRGRRHRAEREADDRAHHDVGAGEHRLAQRYPRRVHAHRREVVLARLLAQLDDLVARGLGLEQRVVDQLREIGRHLADAGRRADAHRAGALHRAHRPRPAHDARPAARAVLAGRGVVVAVAAVARAQQRLGGRVAARRRRQPLLHALRDDLDELVDFGRRHRRHSSSSRAQNGSVGVASHRSHALPCRSLPALGGVTSSMYGSVCASYGGHAVAPLPFGSPAAVKRIQ